MSQSKRNQLLNNKIIDIFMEFVPGGSLKFILNNFVKFKEKLVRSYTMQILEGLKTLHDNGIWHGDLKVCNLLIDDLGIIKITDFSFIKQVLLNTSKFGDLKAFMDQGLIDNDEFEKLNSPMWGSENYTAPEVIRDPSSKMSAANDIWALGCIVVEMLTGKEPWHELEGNSESILK